jgi:hypothetical protein
MGDPPMNHSPGSLDSESSNCDSAAGRPVARAMRNETIAMTEKILKVESEIDDRVKGLYGL